jgi:hypothetical protein
VRLLEERKQAEEALREAANHRDGMEALRREMNLMFARAEQIRCDELRYLDPEDQRKVLMASRTTATIDQLGNVTITGLLNLDIAELLPTEGLYETRPGGEESPRHEGVVKLGSTPWPF